MQPTPSSEFARSTPGRSPITPAPGFVVHTRRADGVPESGFEKPMVLPALDEKSPSMHAWSDARFAVEIMAEHALFFVLLMPLELAPQERADAEHFHRLFTALYERIEAEGPPEPSALKAFATSVLEQIKPFIEYKARLGEAQASGKLRSLYGRCFSITPDTRRSAGPGDWRRSRGESPSSTSRKSAASGPTSWMNTPASSRICSIRTNSS